MIFTVKLKREGKQRRTVSWKAVLARILLLKSSYEGIVRSCVAIKTTTVSALIVGIALGDNEGFLVGRKVWLGFAVGDLVGRGDGRVGCEVDGLDDGLRLFTAVGITLGANVRD